MSYRISNDLVLFFVEKTIFPTRWVGIFDDDKLEGHSKNFKLDHTYLPFISFLPFFVQKKLSLTDKKWFFDGDSYNIYNNCLFETDRSFISAERDFTGFIFLVNAKIVFCNNDL